MKIQRAYYSIIICTIYYIVSYLCIDSISSFNMYIIYTDMYIYYTLDFIYQYTYIHRCITIIHIHIIMYGIYAQQCARLPLDQVPASARHALCRLCRVQPTQSDSTCVPHQLFFYISRTI